MTRGDANKILRNTLDAQGLADWKIRGITDTSARFLGLCDYANKTIILHHYFVETNVDDAIYDVIYHEVAHALCPGHGHDEVWAAKARELGCKNTLPCPGYSFNSAAIDAIRSGADIEVTFETETHVVHKPKYTVTRFQEKCKTCGAIAKEQRSEFIPGAGAAKNSDLKIIHLECGHRIYKDIPKGTPFHKLSSFWWDEERGCPKNKHDWEGNRCVTCGETKGFEFQVEGARFLESAVAAGMGGAIFDEMGLGKTIQVLLYLKYHPELFPVLFVVKSGIKFQWQMEIIKWLGFDFMPQVFTTTKEKPIKGMKTYVVSYDIFTQVTKKSKSGKEVTSGKDFKEFDFVKTVVLDECHQIKNPDAARTQNIRKLIRRTESGKVHSKKVIALSGTPWKNNGAEFFTVLNMLDPLKFPTYMGYLQRWVKTSYDGKLGGIKNPEHFRDYIKDIAIRREVADVAIQMPSVSRSLHYLELDAISKSEIEDAEDDFATWYNSQIIGGDENSMESRMRVQAELMKAKHLIGLAKIPGTIEYLDEFIWQVDKKITLFVHHRDVMSLIYEQIKDKYPGYKVFKLTADLTSEQRFQTAEEFQKTEKAIMLASTLASGEGINLQSCGHAVLVERQWNPQNEDQAAPGRFRRIGSAHDRVDVKFMVAAGTTDDILSGIVERKRKYFHEGMNKGAEVTFDEGNIMKELIAEILARHRAKNSRLGI